MKQKYQPLFQTYTFSNQITLKNRFVLAPLTHSSSREDRTISEEEIPYIADLSKDVGLAMTAATYVSDNGKAFPGQASIAHDWYIPGLQRQAKAMKTRGAKAIMQLHHGGNMAPSELVPEGDIVAPSTIAKKEKEQPRSLTNNDIEQIIHDFGEAARRAIEAGFDGVEIHGVNHYLLQQFYSPYFNDRTDQWGGTERVAISDCRCGH